MINDNKHYKWKLVSIDAHEQKCAHSVHQVTTDAQKQGLRMWLTFTFMEIGRLAPLFVSVMGQKNLIERYV